MPELEVIIGLEVHAQMSTNTKMFCGCDNDAFGKEPNTTVCPICMGHPGTLPVPNKDAIEKAIRMSLALQCTVHTDSHFDRKHYFYPDLPSGFQISQYDFPIATGGIVEYEIPDVLSSESLESLHRCKIHRLHMENDAGKLMHVGKKTLCDYNRAGTPLMEIVTEPDLRSADDAVAFAEELRRILIAVNASDADMYKGMMRFDASISLREKGSEKLNPRSEIKNLNSFKALSSALEYEENRLRKLWKETGGPLKGDSTVGWLDTQNFQMTQVLRDKESADEYRYFPEPDIPPLVLDESWIENMRAELPLLPRMMKKKYHSLGLTTAEAQLLIDEPSYRVLYDAVYEKTNDAKRSSSIVLTQLKGFLTAHNKPVAHGPSIDQILELVALMQDGKLSVNATKEVLEEMVETGKNAGDIVTSRDLTHISDERIITELVKKAIDANPKAIESFRAGKEAALGAIVGWVMKESKGSADPAKVSLILRKQLEN